MTKDEIVKYWIDSSEVDFQAMESLYDKGHKRLYPATYNRSKGITAMSSKKDKKVNLCSYK